MSTDTTAPRSKILEATLELGRNWALATTLAAFGAAIHSAEALLGAMLHKEKLFTAAIVTAIFWYYLSAMRAFQVAEFKGETKAKRVLIVFIGAALFIAGAGIVRTVGSMADNARAVRICSDYAEKPDTTIYRDAVCQRLYEMRREFEDTIGAYNARHAEH